MASSSSSAFASKKRKIKIFSQQPAVGKEAVLKPTARLSWELLRRAIMLSILYTMKFSGIDDQIITLVKDFYANYSLFPIEMLEHFLKKLGKQDGLFKKVYIIEDHVYTEPIPKGLPRYEKLPGNKIRKCPPEQISNLVRVNEWMIECSLSYTIPRKNAMVKKGVFGVTIYKSYNLKFQGAFPETNLLNTYKHSGVANIKFKREGSLDELMKSNEFKYHLRDLIFTGLHRVQNRKFCHELAMENDRKSTDKQYLTFCGSSVPENAGARCWLCFRKHFGELAQNFGK